MSSTPIKIILGVGLLDDSIMSDDKYIMEAYAALDKYNVTTIDTARSYGTEELLGRTGASTRFTVDTKTPGGIVPGGSTAAGIIQHAKESLERLNTKKVDVYYIHLPDPSLDLEDMLEGINGAYLAGYFERFGLSNFIPADVQRVYDICKEKGYPLPKVYQGSYSPVGRKAEKELFPLLRKLGISYYAYSPLAGGFLAKTKEQIVEGTSRFNKDHPLSGMYHKLFNREAYLASLDMWAEAAKLAGCSRAELAYRWVTFDSALSATNGDGIVLGWRSVEQLNQTLMGLQNGSVGEAAKKKIDEIWKTVEHEAQLDNVNE